MEWVLFALILVVDQITKYAVDTMLPLGSSSSLIPGVFQLTNVHNYGAAWGMLEGQRWLFLLITPVFCGFLVYLMIRFRNKLDPLGRICLALLLSGALGNYIDRCALSYVRDMLDFCLIGFPVFNAADSAITIGAVLLCLETFRNSDGTIFNACTPEKKKDPEGKA